MAEVEAVLDPICDPKLTVRVTIASTSKRVDTDR